MTRAEKALSDMLKWSGTDEPDLYPYVRDFFTDMLGYPKDHIRVSTKGEQGRIPDIVVVSADARPKDEVYWLVGEVKKERGAFRSAQYRREVWEDQLKDYVSPDTVYALLIDPTTLTVLRPDGSEIKTVELDSRSTSELLSPTADCSLVMLHYDNSLCDTSLSSFKDGLAPSRYLDVTNEKDRKKFYRALRLSARELIDFSLVRLQALQGDYEKYQADAENLKAKIGTIKDEHTRLAWRSLRGQYRRPIRFVEKVLKAFEAQVGRQLPKKEDEARRFIQNLYATEGSSLVLARILFVRFLEDHDMTLRKISNGGIKAFRDYHRHIKDDYQFLLTDAYKEAEQLYRRLFEKSMFDWSHRGDGELSRLLLRIFYRLNSFEFAKISGDILGNLYERFLDVDKRKKLGEYYTPFYVARYVLDRIGFYDNPAPLLDPACGSGTFLIVAAVGLIERLVRKGVKLDVAMKQAVDLVHGLDINMFAAFIAQLQLIWHLLPYLKQSNMKELPEFKVYGGTNSLVYLDQNTLLGSGLFGTVLDLPIENSVRVRDSKFHYVVGNPPYIRNERLKDTGSWRGNYEDVDFRNSDVAYFFVARAIEGRDGSMPPWLEDGGRMCFVLPMGLCDSETARPIRERLMRYKILEITDLEQVAIHIFPSPQASGRATVAPVLLFVEKTLAEQNNVELVQVAEEAAVGEDFQSRYLDHTTLAQSVFAESSINPHAQFLTKLKAEDIPILEVLSGQPLLQEYVVESTPTYGIKVGGAGRLSQKPLVGLLPIGKGQNISSYYLNTAATNWVDTGNVADSSIWGRPETANVHQAYALSEITMTLQCALFDPTTYALSNVTVVFVPRPKFCDFPWDILLNSSVLRFVHLVVLRVSLVGVGTPIEGGRRVSWCHTYPRTLSFLPMPRDIMNYAGELSTIGATLRALAAKIARRWETITEELSKSTKKPLALQGVDFSNWQSDIEEEVDFRLAQQGQIWTLRPYTEKDQQTLLSVQGSYELLNVVKYLLEEREEEELSARDFQNLAVPEHPEPISNLLDTARDSNSPDIREFKRLFKQADDIIAHAYGLSDDQWKYIQRRLTGRPFDVLEPRWAWKAVEMREIQEYDVDRFA